MGYEDYRCCPWLGTDIDVQSVQSYRPETQYRAVHQIGGPCASWGVAPSDIPVQQPSSHSLHALPTHTPHRCRQAGKVERGVRV